MRQSTMTSKNQALKWARWLLILTVVLGLSGELIGRYFGLGSPPLLVVDPQIEYYNKPSSSYHRFGNHIQYNAYGMRCGDFPQTKGSEDELRVMVLGDSVMDGGALSDQSEIVTTLLKTRLHDGLGRPIVVGNISAGSWGPVNLLAYVKRFGLFDADLVVIILSSHDYADNPTFAPITRPTEDRSPTFALEELVTRYLPRYLPGRQSAPADKPVVTPQAIDQAQKALRELIDKARATGARVILAQHLEKTEAQGTTLPGGLVNKQTAQDMGVPIIQLGPAFAEAIKAGDTPYRDYIHPNAFGQELIAEALYTAIMAEVKQLPEVKRSYAPRERHRNTPGMKTDPTQTP